MTKQIVNRVAFFILSAICFFADLQHYYCFARLFGATRRESAKWAYGVAKELWI